MYLSRGYQPQDRFKSYFLDLPFDFGPLLKFTLTRLALIPS